MHSNRENFERDDFDQLGPADNLQQIGSGADMAETLDSFHAIETLFERVRLPDEMSGVVSAEPTRLDLPGFDEIDTLGSGGFGTVFLAHDRKLERNVAVKVPRADRWVARDDRQRFLEEARLAAKLQHPGIVTLLELIEHDDRYHLVSEYIEGTTLQELLERGVPTSQRSAQLAQQIADALEHAHSNHVIHRDLKPTNILIDKEGNPRIADFGLAIRNDTTTSTHRIAAGTLEYMSPEQLPTSDQTIDHRTDIWSFGVVFYEMLTGKLPFSGNSPDQLFASIRDASPPAPRSMNASIPRPLEQVCLRCLSQDPDQRFQSAAELSSELRHVTRNSRPMQTAVIGLAVATVVAIAAFFTGRHFFGSESTVGPLVSSMRIQHYRFNPDGTGIDLGKLGEDSSLVIENDSIDVEVEFSRPAYFFLLELTSSGSIINHCSIDRDDKPVTKISFPVESDVDLRLTDGPGSCMFAVVASTSPLDPFDRWRDKNPAIQWSENQHDGVWQYRKGRIHEMKSFSRSTQERRKAPPDPIARACEQLDKDKGSELSAIAFSITPQTEQP